MERLISLAYPSTGPSVRDALGRDAFIDALNDPEFKVREKEPKHLSYALTLTMKLEVLSKAREVQKETSKPWLSRVTQVAEPPPTESTQLHQEVQQAKPRFHRNSTKVTPHYDQPRRNDTALVQREQTSG